MSTISRRRLDSLRPRSSRIAVATPENPAPTMAMSLVSAERVCGAGAGETVAALAASGLLAMRAVFAAAGHGVDCETVLKRLWPVERCDRIEH